MWPSWMDKWATCTDGRVDKTLEQCREGLQRAKEFGAKNTVKGLQEVILHLKIRQEALRKVKK